MASKRLKRSFIPPVDVKAPSYVPADHGIGIVHIGLGAFHRAHQAVYTDTAIGLHGGDWRIMGISLRSQHAVEQLNPQDGLYSVAIRNAPDSRLSLRLIGSVACAVSNRTAPERVRRALAAETTRIVSLTITEKAYGIDANSRTVDPTHSSIAHDLEHPDAPEGAIGLIVQALKHRRDENIEPFTLLCCDNLSNNGAFLKAGLLDFARRTDASLVDWIDENVACPSTMVDRITPAPNETLLLDVEKMLGVRDSAAVETEPFTQWVIEDRFPTGRPAWESAGALFVDDVHPFETMKLRMLNGAHSLIAYAGYAANHEFVRDVMSDATFRKVVSDHLRAAAATLAPLPPVSFEDYAEDLLERFSNHELKHRTYQIAMDGTQKLPQRLLDPAVHAANHDQALHTFAFAVAAWMRHCMGIREDGTKYELQDPRADEIKNALTPATSASDIHASLCSLPGLFPASLYTNEEWNALLVRYLDSMLTSSVGATMERLLTDQRRMGTRVLP